MSRFVVSLLIALGACCSMGAARTVGIEEVLAHSQETRLEGRVPASASSESVARIRATWARLLVASPPPHAIELRVMQGGLQAEAMLGRLLVVGESVGDLPENERAMLLAHEYGHLVLGHWGLLVAMYQQYIPGEVRPETTDPVAQALGRDGRALSHRQELEADAFGYRLAQQLNVTLDDALSLLMRQPVTNDTPTHPATRRRIAQLRALQMRSEDEAGDAAAGRRPVRAVAASPRP